MGFLTNINVVPPAESSAEISVRVPAAEALPAGVTGIPDDRLAFFPAKTDAVKGVALVLHGLNLRPGKMEGIIGVLNKGGIETANLSLSGHGDASVPGRADGAGRGQLSEFKGVSFPLWLEETCQAYRKSLERSRDLGVPLFFVGYSLGGLLGTSLLASIPGVKFRKMVLLAPAFILHGYNHMVRLLSPFPGVVVPSASCGNYCANRGTPMAAYNSLFDGMKRLERNMGPGIDVPTLIFMDRYDELVSYKGLKRIVREKGLSRWRFHLVRKSRGAGGGLRARMRHLIIDEATVGTATWREMSGAMLSHLED